MTEQLRIHQIARAVGVGGPLLLSGSGVMALHGMNRVPNDIDIFVTTGRWFDLYREGNWDVFVPDVTDRIRRCDPPYLLRTMYGIEVNVFHSWRTRGMGDIDVARWFRESESVQGIECIPLKHLMMWKMEIAREKDEPDVFAIQQHLQVCQCAAA